MRKFPVLLALATLILSVPSIKSYADVKKEAIPRGHAKLVFKRISRLLVSAPVPSRVRINNEELASLSGDDEETRYYKAGTYIIEVDSKFYFAEGSRLKVTLKPGKTYHFLVSNRDLTSNLDEELRPEARKVSENGDISQGLFDISLMKMK